MAASVLTEICKNALHSNLEAFILNDPLENFHSHELYTWNCFPALGIALFGMKPDIEQQHQCWRSWILRHDIQGNGLKHQTTKGWAASHSKWMLLEEILQYDQDLVSKRAPTDSSHFYHLYLLAVTTHISTI